MSLENISCQKSFGGWHKRYRHRSDVLGCDMVFAVYLPPQAEQGGKLPVLYWFCLLFTSPSPRDGLLSRMPSSA